MMNWSDWGPPGLKSCVVAAPDGVRWRLAASLPEGDAPPDGWPTLWVLDGDQHGLTLMDTARRLGRRPDVTGVAPMAVVAVMGADGLLDAARRHHVFTAGPPADPEQARGDWTPGGAPALLRFLQDDARIAAAALGQLSEAAPVLWGHSLSGWFALWSAAAAPRSFAAVAAISPSLWWDEAPLGALETASAPLYLAAGARESDDRPGGRRMIGRARDLAARLTAAGRAARFKVFEDEDHASIVSASAADALRFLSGR